jgi:hypothetical protein
MSTVDLDFISKSGFYNINQALSDEEFVQVAAATFDPVGLTGPMSVVPHGITQALEASGGSDSIAVVNIAIPPLADKTKVATVRVGWSTPSTTVANVLDLSIQYVWLEIFGPTNAVPDGEVFCACNPVGVANGYQFSSFELPAPGVATRICQLRLTRYGSSDTESAVANTMGLILAFTPIRE